MTAISNSPIWRYLSLAKYIDLLRTQSLYFPKVSRFQDETEGKWWGHAYLYENAQRWGQSPANSQILKKLLERAGNDESAIVREINKTLHSANDWVRNILLTALRAYPHKRREYLESVISSWKRHYDDHSLAVRQWKLDLDVFRESTYVSCWNRSSSMSLAMWEMYGGSESVAVRSTINKLKGLIEANATILERQGLAVDIAEVEYLEGLKNPNEGTQERIYQIIFEKGRDHRVGLFTIKPDVYRFEEEVRAILYPKRGLLDPIEDPHPNVSGFSIPINPEADGKQSLADFIERVYVHPMLDKDSLMVQAVTEINKRFNVRQIPVVSDKIEALGSDVTLP